MELSRRDFLKITGAGTAGAAAAVALSTISDAPALGRVVEFPLDPLVEEYQPVPTICCYCSVGCGAMVIKRKHPEYGDVIRIEGDPDHPINRGSLCPKGSAMYQIHSVDGRVDIPNNINSERVTRPWYRRPGGLDWEPIEWEDALDMIAARVKDTRDRRLIATDPEGRTVNRNEGMGSFGGGELDNEECYLLAKMSRALGVVYLEHCARL